MEINFRDLIPDITWKRVAAVSGMGALFTLYLGARMLSAEIAISAFPTYRVLCHRVNLTIIQHFIAFSLVFLVSITYGMCKWTVEWLNRHNPFD